MTNKILRADGTTQISNIKSCVYTENVNASTDLRPGCVSSACINVTVYGAQSSAPSSGEALTYYQVDSDGTETLIGTFYAEPAITTRDTYTFIAYDAASKLDVDFSETLKSIQSSFPMTVYEIVQRACTVAGITLTSSSWPLSTQMVQAFSGDGISCRDIVSWAAEIACRFVRCNTSGGLVFTWYSASNTSIGTSAGTNQIAYKQDGLYYENYSVRAVGSVAVRPVGSEGSAYIYPQSVNGVYASADDNGVVTLYNITASDDGNGNVTLSGAFTAEDDGNGNVSIVSDSIDTNSLVISGNLLLMSASSTVMNAVAQNIYTEMRSLPSWRPSQISVFSFENVFRAGDVVTVTDSQGVSFTTLVMKLSISTNGASLSSSGNQIYSDYESGSNKALANLSANLIKFSGDVVFVNDLTDGSTVISGDNIQTGTIAAERIDAQNLQVQAANITGTLTIGQLPSDVATDSEVTTITETTIQTTSVTANNLVVKAANITGTLTASQIDATNLQVSAANITGTLTISQLPSSVATESEVTTITETTLSTTNVLAQNLQVKAANITGTLSASQIDTSSITLSTSDGYYKTTMSGGQINSFYDNTQYGTIVATYLSSNSTVRGISLRATSAGDFVTIGTMSGTTYSPKFVVTSGNYLSNYTEPVLVLDSMLTYTIRLRNSYYLCWYNSSGTAYSFAYLTSNNLFYLGHTSYPTYVQGSTLYLGSTAYATYLRGSSVNISGNVAIGDSSTSYTLKLNGVTVGGSSVDIVATYQVLESGTVNWTGSHNGSVSITKSGYYPLGIVGFYTGATFVTPTNYYLSNRATGSCTVNYWMYNISGGSTTNSVTTYCYVLWYKAS